tara:strand:- start:6347 stop:7423 length:1077 start_codon:yes stop_codon:yes gene_type:complete
VPLSKISLRNFRCFDSLELSLSEGVNFFYGPNGSGKTSLLESIYLFSSGKSFKSTNLASLIKHNNKKFLLRGYDGTKGDVVEIEKIIDKPISVSLNNKKIASKVLLKKFPCTPIHNNTFSFASAPPDFRRKLLDRSVATCEELFMINWFAYYRALKQRNTMLKNNRISDIYAWNTQLVEYGNVLTDSRKLFFKKTLNNFRIILDLIDATNVFDFLGNIEISFYQGWDNNDAFLDILEDNFDNDRRRKTTLLGPHKSDIKFSINSIDAKQILSRGEQKFFSILWSCAQNEVLKNDYKINPLLIIDDVKSELDERVFNLFLEILKHSKNQIIFSCIDHAFSSKIAHSLNQFKMFHVEQLR